MKPCFLHIMTSNSWGHRKEQLSLIGLHAEFRPSTSIGLHQIIENLQRMTAGGHSGIICCNQDHIIHFDSLATVIQALGSGIMLNADRGC